MFRSLTAFILILSFFSIGAFGKQSVEASDLQGLTDKAVAEYMEGRIAQAYELAERAIDEEPRASLAYAVKALYLLRKRKYAEANNLFNKAESISRENILQGTESESLNHIAKYRLLQHWNTFFEINNDPPYSQEWNDDRKNSVRSDLSKLNQPGSAFDYFVRGLANVMLARNAEPDLLKAVQLNPRFAVAYVRLGRVSLSGNDHARAADYFRQAIGINSSYSDAYNALGDSFYFAGNQEAAIENYTKAIQLDSQNEIAYFNRGESYRLTKRYDAALADFNRAIELHPKYSDAFNSRGIIYFYEKNQKDAALEDFTKAIQANSRNGFAYLNRGIYYSRKGDFFAARGNLEEAVRYYPNGSAYLELGYAANQTGAYDKSLPALNKAIELLPDNSAVYFHRGFAHRETGNFEAAIADYSKSIQLYSKEPAAFYNRGLIYFNDIQNFEAAIADFSKAIELNPQNWDAYFYRANVYESLGKQNLADADRKKLKDLKDVALKDPKRFLRTLYPNAVFDADLAKNLLAPGTSAITGKACAYYGQKFNAANVKIFLYPVTPYFEAWHKLRGKQEDDLTAVYLSKKAARYRLETQANDEGKFVFRNLKPGRYFVQTIFNFTYQGTRRVYSGTETTRNGPFLTTTNYYYDQDYTVDRNNRLESFIEIKNDGEIVKTEIAKGGGMLRKGC